MKSERFLFRRQFIFSPRRVNCFSDWNRSDLPDGSFLTVHPDLTFTIAKKNKDFIVLLGYILDPYNPYRNNEHIVNDMLVRSRCCEDLFKYLEPTGGRYVIMASLQNSKIMLTDPAGFRQLFYMKDSRGQIWISSQPALLADIFNLQVDETVEKDLYSIPLFAHSFEYWYPGVLTAFYDVNHLLPNHFLDLKTFRQTRYWPVERLEEVKLEDCVENCAEILRGLYWSIENRFELAQAVTAGLDSRVILAASRYVGRRIHYLTHTHNRLGVTGVDIVIPSKMLPALNLEHRIVFHSERMEPEFERIYRHNVTTARFQHGLNAYAIHRHFKNLGKEMVVINGVCGEITRNFYYLPKLVSINGYSLSGLTRMKGSLLALEQFESWLKQGREISAMSGIGLLDLFYWEQRVGNWAAMSYSEYDIAFESFSPLNCRYLLQSMLGVKQQYRNSPENYLQTQLIKRLWPDTLKFAINPPESKKSKLIMNIKRTPLRGILKTIKFLRYSGMLFI